MKLLLCVLICLPSLASESKMSSPLQQRLDQAVSNIISAFAPKNLKADELAVTVRKVTDPTNIETASYRGDAPIYPASVVKLFYLVAAHRWLEDGKIQASPELDRAVRDMIVESSNDATHYVIDLITGTTGGPELPAAEMAAWSERRNVINRYFAAEAYSGINVNQKPWGDGPYGRERVFVGAHFENRNALTTDATSRLLSDIVFGRAISPARSAQMMTLLQRDIARETAKSDDETQAFTASALPAGSRLWSKAGWTSQTRHDAAYIELPDKQKLILVIFTVNHSKDRDLIPRFVREILKPL